MHLMVICANYGAFNSNSPTENVSVVGSIMLHLLALDRALRLPQQRFDDLGNVHITVDVSPIRLLYLFTLPSNFCSKKAISF